MESGDVLGLIDPTLEEKYDSDQMQRLILTASFCVRQSSTWRPSMSEVTQNTTQHDNLLITYDNNVYFVCEFIRCWRF